jgi:uncharacterized protein YkvS
MPPVVTFVAAIGAAAAASVGVAVAAGGISAFAIGAAVVVGGSVIASRLMALDLTEGMTDNDQSRQVTTRSTIEPQKIIYGQALVSGPLAFVGVSGAGNKDLHHVVALAGHQVESIIDVWLDDQIISNPSGNVTSGKFAPLGGDTIVNVAKYLGTSAQNADATLVAAFTGYTSAHRGRGIAYIRTTFTLTDASQELWDKYAPANIMARVKGNPNIYDPRLDSTAGDDPTNASFIAWTDNPALCLANYLTDSVFGMKISASKIDWAAVVVAADACDSLVDIPGGATEKRFTSNGVLFASDTHRTNVDKIKSAMNGTLVYTSGVYVIRAGIYEAPTESLTEDDLAGQIDIVTSVQRSDRYNTVGGVFIDPEQNNKSVEFPKMVLTAALERDNNEVLEREIDLPFTNSTYMAQRIAHKLIQISDQQKIVTFPCNLSGVRVAVGDRVNVSISELNWTNKVFRCMEWNFTDEGGVDLTLAEDDSGSYADPAVNEYSTTSSSGAITEGFPGVPGPQLLTAVAGIKSIDLNWTNPANVSKFAGIIIYASPNSDWGNAVEIGRGLATSFKHDSSTAADPITAGATRFYWVRAIGTGVSGSVFSDRNPDNDTSTITATSEQSTASLGVSLFNSAGDLVDDVDVLNLDLIDLQDVDGSPLLLEDGATIQDQRSSDVAAAGAAANAETINRVRVTEDGLTGVATRLTEVSTTVGEQNTSLTETIESVAAAGAAANAETINRVRVTEDGLTGLATRLTEVSTTVGEQNTSITETIESINDGLTGVATRLTEVSTTVDEQNTSITETIESINDGLTGVATRLTEVSTTVDEQNTSITETIESINGIGAKFGVEIDANGNLTGFELLGDGTRSAFRIKADDFLIVDPDNPDGDAQAAWLSVVAGVTTLQNLVVNGSLIVNGTVDTAELSDNAATKASSVSLASSETWGDGTARDILTLTFTGEGFGAEIFADFTAGAPGSYNMTVSLVVNGTTIRSFQSGSGPISITGAITSVDGSNTAILRVDPSSARTVTIPTAYLRALETKR